MARADGHVLRKMRTVRHAPASGGGLLIRGGRIRIARRPLAILPQLPPMSAKFLRKEKKLRAEAEVAVRLQQTAREEALKTPQFSKLGRPGEVLRTYVAKRSQLTPADAAAAFYALGRMNRNAAYKIGTDPRANDGRAVELRADLAVSAPYLRSRDVANALLGAAYSRTSDQALLDALCTAAAAKAPDQFSLRDVSSTVYALGRLGRRDTKLLPALLSRVSVEAPLFHAIEMSLTASGLADLEIAPPTALGRLSRAAIPKLDQFGAAELPRLLAALASLGWRDELLLRLSAERLPLLLADMEPKGLSATAAVLASADMWIPSALHILSTEASRKAPTFSARHASVTLAALGRMRWEHSAALDRLVRQIVHFAERNEAELCDLALAVRALSRTTPPPDEPDGDDEDDGRPRYAPGAEAHAHVPTLLQAATRLLVKDSGPTLAPPPGAQRRHGGASGMASPSMLPMPSAFGAGALQIPTPDAQAVAAPAAPALADAPGADVPAHMHLGGVDPVEVRIATRRDLAMLCNGATILGVTPPFALIQHVRGVVDDMNLEDVDVHARRRETRERRAQGLRDGRAERRTRAKLTDALRRWETADQVRRSDNIEEWIDSLGTSTRGSGASKRRGLLPASGRKKRG